MLNNLLNNNTNNNAEGPAECWHGMTIVFVTKFLQWRKFFKLKKSWLVNKHTRITWGSQTTRTKPLGEMTKHTIRMLSEQTAMLARKITGLSVSIASGISNKPSSSPMMELIPISGKPREVNFQRKRVNVLPQLLNNACIRVHFHASDCIRTCKLRLLKVNSE